jgi:hypothetical protein
LASGHENLIPFNKRSVEEAREFGRRGGKASGEARRRKANFRKELNDLLTTEVNNPEWSPVLEAMGLDNTLGMVMHAAMIKEALKGNVKAYEAIAKYSGQSAQTEADDEEQKIRTDRAKRARDQEVGGNDGNEENIQSFLKAMKPTQEDMEALFDEEPEEIEEVDDNAEDSEETSDV